MLTVVTLLLAAWWIATQGQPAAAREGRATVAHGSSFCAELEGPPVLAISANEDFMPFEDEQTCSDSDALEPHDIEAPVDAV